MKSYRRKLIAITSLVAVAIGTAVLRAQTTDTNVNVPFAFTAGTASLPRGAYRLSTLPGHLDAVMIRSAEQGVIMLSQPAGSTRRDTTAGVVFDRYGDQYFLRAIRLYDNIAFEFPKSAGEHAAAERLASNVKPEMVVVPLGQ